MKMPFTPSLSGRFSRCRAATPVEADVEVYLAGWDRHSGRRRRLTVEVADVPDLMFPLPVSSVGATLSTSPDWRHGPSSYSPSGKAADRAPNGAALRTASSHGPP